MKNSTSLEQCLRDEYWYTCPIPLIIFIIFFLLFVYSCYILAKCGELIKAAETLGTEAFEIKYGKKLKDVTSVYVVNLVVCILSIIVLTFFLYKAIPVEKQQGLFNQYIGGVIIFYIFIVTSITLSFFNTVKSSGRSAAVVWMTSIILAITIAAILLISFQVYEFILNKRQQRISK